MAHVSREELRTHALLAFARHKVDLNDLEIVSTGPDGAWRIGARAAQSANDPAILAVVAQVEAELSALYRLSSLR